MKKKGKRPALVNLAITALVTTVLWVGFESFRSFSIEPSPTVPEEILQPFSPTLDSQALNELQNKIHLEEFEIGNTVLLGSPDLSNIIEEEEDEGITIPEATEEAQLQ